MSDQEKMDIYKICVEMADRTSERRLKNNSFLLTLNSAILSLAGFLFLKPNMQPFFIVALSFCCIIINVYWLFLVLSYKKINTAKYVVITKIEDTFSIKPFQEEQIALDATKHYKLSDIEKFIPITLILLNLFLIFMMTFIYKEPIPQTNDLIINVIAWVL